MITALAAGVRVMLPSGSVIVLVRPEGAEWVCQYTERALTRGEVVFSDAFLRAHGRLA